MKKYIFSVCIILSFLKINAQMTGVIRGSISGHDFQPLRSATVQLFNRTNKRLIKVAITDNAGLFEFTKLPAGIYFISISNTGSETSQIDQLEISAEKMVIQLPPVSISDRSTSLKEVKVDGRKPMIENRIDRMIVNVDAFIGATGGTAMEVLEKSPGINIDNDGNISLKGKQGAIILLDGKQTYLGGQDLANFLRNMPSNRLESIEIMTQPSSKYDAAGNSGIINIKTKKNSQPGFNGSINLSYVQGAYPKSPNSILLNFKQNKLNLFLNYSYSYLETFSDVAILRKFKDSNAFPIGYFDQSTFQKSAFNNNNLRFGIDYSLSKRSTVGFMINGIYNPRNQGVLSRSNIFNGTDNLDSINLANSNTTDPRKNFGENLNFRTALDTLGSEITADIDYVLYKSRSNQLSDNYTFIPPSKMPSDSFLLRAYLPADITIYSTKIDFSHPLTRGARIEAGAKSSYVTTDNDAQYTKYDNQGRQWIVDLSRSNHFIYKENINALYANYSRQINKFGLQAGLRAEQTISNGRQLVDNKVFTKNYVQIFPTVYLSYALNPKSRLGLSYGRRIDRPSYQDLNPFQYFLDQYTYKQGNPFLQPQFSNNFEFSYNFKGEINIVASYTQTMDIINDVLKQNDSTKVIFQTRENIATRNNFGIAVNYSKLITKWWTANFFINGFENQFRGIVNKLPLSVNVASFTFNANNQFHFKKGWGVEASGFYRSQMLTGGINISRPFGVISFGASKQILKNKGALRLILSDPFNIQVFRGFTKFGNIDAEIKNRSDNRRLGIGFTYRFGATAGNGQQRRRPGSSQDEQNRVNIGVQQ